MDMAPLKYNSLFEGASNGTHKSNYKCRRRLRTEEGHLNTALATTTACRLKEVVWYYMVLSTITLPFLVIITVAISYPCRSCHYLHLTSSLQSHQEKSEWCSFALCQILFFSKLQKQLVHDARASTLKRQTHHRRPQKKVSFPKASQIEPIKQLQAQTAPQ